MLYIRVFYISDGKRKYFLLNTPYSIIYRTRLY